MKILFLMVIISLLFTGCAYNITMKNGYPTTETIPKEFQGKHDYQTLIQTTGGAQPRRDVESNLTLNAIIDILRSNIGALGDSGYAQATIIDPSSRLNTSNWIQVFPYYRNKNIVCLSFNFWIDRKSKDENSGDKLLFAVVFIEYDTNTNKIIRENISEDEVMDNKRLFIELQLKPIR